jgi:hypothetical protein
MNIINSYHFGLIVVNGQKYTSDIIIFPDRIRDNWRRKSSHKLRVEDIAEVITENPEVLIVGTGAFGVMKVLPEVVPVVEPKGIKLITEATDKACNTYNQICHSQRVVAALHITC